MQERSAIPGHIHASKHAVVMSERRVQLFEINDEQDGREV